MKIRPLSRRDIRRNLIIKWVLYFLLMCVAFIFLTTGTNTKPLVLIPIAICISVYEEFELVSSLVGTFCGLMLDCVCGKTIGYNAILLTVICMFTSLMFLYLMRKSIINLIILNSAAVIILGLLDYLFFYGIWRYDTDAHIFLTTTLPSMLYTIISGPVIFVAVWFINRKFGPREEYFMAEQSEDIVRE